MSYRLADSTAAVPLLPPEDDGTRAGTKEGRGWRGEGGGGGYGGGKDDGRSALRKRITLCGPTKTNRARGSSDPLHPPREPPLPSSYFVARCISK